MKKCDIFLIFAQHTIYSWHSSEIKKNVTLVNPTVTIYGVLITPMGILA